MKKKNKLIIILIVLLANIYYSQLNSFNKDAQNVASPEIVSLMRFTDFPENNYIGKTNISIPFYNINFGKLSIPLGLSYNTKGNKVADIATSVGLGWNLNAGGNLTVKVNDMNDFTETYSYYTTATFEPLLSLAWHRQTRGFLSVDNPQVNNLCLTDRIWENDDVFIDSAPDFYYMNAPGLNDKFYFRRLDNNQLQASFFNTNAKLNNTLNFINRTDCNGFESDQFGHRGKANVFYQIEKFEIIGENGYVYTFSDIESSIITEYPFDYFSHNTLQVNNWYLTKIKDPFSGREIIFEYEGYSNPYEHSSLTTLGDINFSNYPVANNIELGTRGTNIIAYPYYYNRVTTSVLIPRRLKKITTDKEIVDFTYSFSRLDYPGNGLTRISIKNRKGNIFKDIDFNYDYFESANCSAGNYECKRLKLSSINDSSSGLYKFYYDNNSFPPRNSSKVDYLGYFNNNNSNIIFSKYNFHETQNGYYPNSKIYFYPDLDKNQLFPFMLANKSAYAVTDGVDRTPNINSKLGLLQKIVYPTGGSLELSYELDDFMYEGLKYNLGSTRINKMKFIDSHNITSKEVNFKYINPDNTSSGLINFISTPANSVRSEIASGIGFNTGAIIGYSRVIEQTVGKGSIEKKYTNFNDFSDRFMKSDHNFTDQASKNFLKFMKFPYSYVQSFEDRRGKLKEENYYTEGLASPTRKVSYIYDYVVKDSLKVKKLFSTYDSYGDWDENYTASNSVIRYFNNVKKITNSDFLITNSIASETFFDYDNARLIYKKNISGGDTTEEYYRNAKDKSIQKLIDANIYDLTVEVENKKNNKTIGKTEIKFENSFNILPSSEYSLNLQSGNTEPNIVFDLYDSKGNLLQYTQSNGIPVSLIWGYDSTQLIAKIIGAPYSQVSLLATDIILASSTYTNTTTGETLISKLETFRKQSALSGFQITTYTYNPLIGVTSITPPSGITENYKYDSQNRLEKVVDVNGKIIKEYNYNYAPTNYYNVAKSQSFTKNNCTNGQISTTQYVYSVAANTYSSLISQADADQKAQNDINTNGQAYANANGTCYNPYCQLNTQTSSNFFSLQYAPFEKINNTVNAYIYFVITANPGLNWSNGVLVGYIDTLCLPATTITRTSGNWQITIYQGSGQVVLRWTGSGAPAIGGYYSVNFNYNLN